MVVSTGTLFFLLSFFMLQDMVPPLATLEMRSSLFPIGHRWSRRPPHLPPPTEPSARYGSTAGHAGDEVVPLPHRPQMEPTSSPSAAADGAEVIPSCRRRRQTPPLPQWWQLDGSQEKQGKRKGAKRQGKWTVSYN
uniref:Uncharacterized protein n=1 Tax=Oryza barthii TaxID=65489 RepID=A0A0D3GHN3_9ORYZ